MENMELYNKFRAVPPAAKRVIGAGRLKDMTDINPMWRIKCLTEAFGPVGFGWYIEKTSERVYEENGENIVVVEINLYVKIDDVWSKPIYGTGGSKILAKEKSGLYADDEAVKKAYTDAISVACKSLGIGADVYFEKDSTKYTQHEQPAQKPAQIQKEKREYSLEELFMICALHNVDVEKVATLFYKKEKSALTAEDLAAALDRKFGDAWRS